MPLTRDKAISLDRADPIAHLRSRFLLPEGVVYLDGNSLGPLPIGVTDRIARLMSDEWQADLIGSWEKHSWIELPLAVGGKLERLIGAESGSVVACDSTSVNWFKAVSAAHHLAEQKVVLTDSGNFPTNRYVLQGLDGIELRSVSPDEVESSIQPDVGVVALTEVDYRTGRRHDLVTITRLAHQVGALVVWDLSHSAGAMTVNLAGAQVDFAVGCGYKFLNGGPGASAYIYVSPSHREGFRNPITGWFGHRAPFDFCPDYSPAEGIDRARVGTPHMLSLAALDAALEAFTGVALEQLRTKSLSLSGLFIDLVEQIKGIEVVTPGEHERRGSQVSIRHQNARALIGALGDRGVVADFRPPDLLRFGFAPMYNTHLEAWTAVDALRTVLAPARRPWR